MYSIPSHPHKLGYRDSDPNRDSQSVVCCHYTIAQYFFQIPVAIPLEQPVLPPDYKRKKRYENVAILNRSSFIILNTHYKRPHPGRLAFVHMRVRTVKILPE